jgi:transcriptional regulator with XRE-family HTH domain
MRIETGVKSASMEHRATPKPMLGKSFVHSHDVRMVEIKAMQIHEFSIIAEGLDPTAEDFESRFYDVGCDDATISFQRGVIILDFARAAETFEGAISSAIKQVEQAGAEIIRVEPEPLVSLSDIAQRAGMTRAAISLYASGQRGTAFPSPVARFTSESPLWNWADVATWLEKAGRIDRPEAEKAKILSRLNQHL